MKTGPAPIWPRGGSEAPSSAAASGADGPSKTLSAPRMGIRATVATSTLLGVAGPSGGPETSGFAVAVDEGRPRIGTTTAWIEAPCDVVITIGRGVREAATGRTPAGLAIAPGE